MAKELPYFKFEPSEWDNGNIQICTRETKGLFIDLCSMYWSRLGELPYALALQKLCAGNDNALHELQKHDIFGVVDGNIVIEFLDEQLSEFHETSEKRRNAANKRWKDASALQKKSKSNAIREDKIREDKSIIHDDSFALFWDKYGKKVQPSKCKVIWKKLSPDEHSKIMIHLDAYTKVDRQFRKDPERYLKNRCWEDEVILFERNQSGVDHIKI